MLAGSSLATVTGSNKLTQDLRCHLLEHMGTDPYNPGYGSLIDGGVNAVGQVVDSPIGSNNWDLVQHNLSIEIRRIIAVYQAAQVERAKTDRLRYNKNTLTTDEMLIGVGAIEYVRNQDQLTVNITLTIGNGATQQIALNLPGVLTV